jgi:hypothetical protein
VACEDLPHRPTSSGDQYAPDSTDNPSDVVPGSNSGKPLPNTGGPPYLVVGAVLLLVAAAMAGRCVLRR